MTANPKTVDEKSSVETDESILAEALARFKVCEEAYAEKRRLFADDLRFSEGGQWDESAKQARIADGRPCLVINKLNQSINQVTNDQRQNRPSIKVHPVDDGGDVEIAKIQQGLIRNIEQISNADDAYDTAFEYTARGGEGFWRVITEYSSPTSFDLDLKIKRIRDPMSVYLDPHSTETDGSDANFGFIFERVSKDEYKRIYGDSELCAPEASDWASYDTRAPGWVTKDSCLVTEYFTKVFEDKQLCLLSSGKVVAKEDVEGELLLLAQQGIEGKVVKERKASIPRIKWYKINGIEILDKTTFPGIYIPIVPCYGAELVVDGKVIHKGITRDAKDPQRMVNFWASSEAEAITTAPKAPYIGVEGQFEGFEKDWASANRKNHAFLQVKQVTVNGNLAPLPQRQSFEPAIQAITNARMIASDDLKASTGIYDAALGAKSNETSGVAIQRRASQGQTANFHLIDNLTRSIKHTGRILIFAIPEVYDSSRAARIITDDGSEKIVRLNEPYEENGEKVLYSFEAGKYDVTIDVGPSYASKRQEAAESMMDFTRAYPQAAQIVGDLIVKNMDWPGASEISERLKKALPPGLADDQKDKGKEIPPQVQDQMKQMNQMIEQLTAKVHEAHDKLEEAEDTIENKRLELESRERIEMKKLEVALEIKRAELDQKDSLALLSAEIEQIGQRLKMVGINQPIPQQDFESYPPEADGAMSADVGPMEGMPTGGESPGLPMEEPIQ